jgi:lysophospholipase L1-like esterase
MTNYSAVWGNSLVYNFAVSGQGSAEALSAYTDTAHTVRPSNANEKGWLFVWIGLNDVGGKTPSEIYFNLKAIWQLGRADGFSVAAFTITRGGAYTPENGLFQQWDELNSLILSDKTPYDALCRPDVLFPAPVDPLYFIDGIHPTPLGAQKIAEWIAQTMDPLW